MYSKRPLLFTILGALFVITGLVTLLGIVTAWNINTPVRVEFFGYAALDFLLAYGFFSAQRWLLPALALNWLAGGALAAVKFFVHTPADASIATYAVSFLLGGLIVLAVYILPRKKFYASSRERLAGAAFVVIWAAIACYTMAGLLT